MNLFQEIALLFKLRSLAKMDIEEARKMNGVKPGYMTTEFWGKVGLQVMTLWGAVSGFVPPKYALIVGTALEAIYTVCRTVSKAVGDIKSADGAMPVTATVTATVTPQ